MSKIEIYKTGLNEAQARLFEEVDNGVYGTGQVQLKKLESINRQFFQSAYVVIKEGAAVARCCVYNNPFLRYENQTCSVVGNFECVNDPEVSASLFKKLADEARARDSGFLIGPMNGSTWDGYRLSKGAAAPLFFLESGNPLYYHDLFENAGFAKISRYVSNFDREQELNEDRIGIATERFKSMGITFRNIDLNNFDSELEKMYLFCMESFSKNFLFTPIDKNIFMEKYMKIKPFINPEYVIIAEDEHRNFAGFIFCLENYSDKNDKGVIIKTLAKKSSVRYGGLGNVLTTMFKKRALANGCKYIIHAFMSESNASRSLSGYFSGETFREYFLYGMKL